MVSWGPVSYAVITPMVSNRKVGLPRAPPQPRAVVWRIELSGFLPVPRCRARPVESESRHAPGLRVSLGRQSLAANRSASGISARRLRHRRDQPLKVWLCSALIPAPMIFDCQLTPSVCPHAAGDSTDMADLLSAVEIQDRHDWLDKDVPTHSSQTTGTRQTSVPGVKVIPNGCGDTPDVDSGKDSGRQHRHRSRGRSRTGSRTTASGGGSEARSANSDRRRRSPVFEGGESANGKSENDRREVSFGPASSSPPRRQQTDEASPVGRSAPLLIEDKQVALVRVQLAERDITGVDDAAIAKELEAQGGHVGRTVNRLKNRPVALPAPVHSRRFGSEQTAAEIAANVAQTAAVAGGAQQRRYDEAALRYYTKAFKVENGRHASPIKPCPLACSPLGVQRARSA